MAKTKEELQEILDRLNEVVEDAVVQRTEFLDKNMNCFAEFEVGEFVFNCSNKAIGIVERHYRFWADQHRPDMDKSFNTECEIRCPCDGNFLDNTSRYAGLHPYVKKQDYDEKNKSYLGKLEMLAAITGGQRW